MHDAQQRPWQRHLVAALQNYQLDESTLLDNLAQLATRNALQYADAAAFSVVLANGFSHSLSFQAIEQHANQLANYLQQHLQLHAGDVVGIQLPNSLHYPIAVFACWKVGLIISNINPLYTARELKNQLQDSAARALIVSDLFLNGFEQVLKEQPELQNLALISCCLSDFFPSPYQEGIAAQLAAEAQAQQRQIQPSITYSTFIDALHIGAELNNYQAQQHDVAVYQYTGGTTGASKGAIIRHANLAALIKTTGDYLRAYQSEFNQNDSILTAIPLYHIFAFTVNFLMFFDAGAHNILVPSPRPILNLKPAFEKFNITWMTGVDPLYAALLHEAWFQAKPPQLTCAISGGTALRPTTAQQWQQQVGTIIEGFGMTETSCAALLHPPIAEIRQGSVGFPLPATDIKIIDAQGQCVALGEAGELCIKGPQVVAGYLNRDAENAESFIDGWLHTGDIAKLDQDGFCYILDRKKDMVNVSGFNVYPNEVEAVLVEHPHILEAAVIAVQDPSTGEAVKAYITTDNTELSIDEVIAHCRNYLTSYKVPKSIEILPELPKSTVGKILRATLRQQQPSI